MYDNIIGSELQFISLPLVLLGQFLLAETHCSISARLMGSVGLTTLHCIAG